jgi:hypothetical protein
MREATLGANMRVAAIAVEGMRRVEVSGREQSLEGERWGENGGEAVLGTLKFQRGHKGKMEAGEGEGEGEGEPERRRKFRDGEGREQRAQGPQRRSVSRLDFGLLSSEGRGQRALHTR